MSQPECKEQIVERDLKIEAWQERSHIERRGDQDKRKKNSKNILAPGRDRRTGKERRDRWLRIGKWRGESVFDE